MQLFLLMLCDGILLCLGQVFLKLGMAELTPWSWTWSNVGRFLLCWKMALCGLSFLGGCTLWMYVLKNFPFSQAYPLSSITYVFGMVAAMFIFREHVSVAQWCGILLILVGCWLIAK